MTDEPYRWMEAMANRREYVEHQLEGGSPLVALSYREGILLFTLGRERQKIFEIYDRIAMGGIGHPGDLERLRMQSIEIASTEGFTRSAQDVSLRRLASYSLSPVLKAAFEQIYGPPFLARLLFAELGRSAANHLFLRLDFDGTLHTNGGNFGRAFEHFGVLAGTPAAMSRMTEWLRANSQPEASLPQALQAAMGAWAVGRLATGEPEGTPSAEDVVAYAQTQANEAYLEVALLEQDSPQAAVWRTLGDAEVRPQLAGR